MPANLEFLTRAGAWFWCVVAVGAAARLFLALATPGTGDVVLWTSHASGVAEVGLIHQYARSELFNHPPPISYVMAWLWEVSQSLGCEFRQLYRVLIALADLGNAGLLWLALRGSRWRAVTVAAYGIAPVALVLAGQHGNTDPLIALCLLAATLLVSRGRAVLAGVVIGVSAWIKLPGLLAAPALGFALPRWRDRFACAAVALAVAASGFVPAFIEAADFAAAHPRLVPTGANLVWERVFAYRGVMMVTVGEPQTWVWGFKNFFTYVFGYDPRGWPYASIVWIYNSHNAAMALMWVFFFLRRRERDAIGLGATIALGFALFYGLSESWAFQYFAWTMPLWMLAGTRFAVAANVCGGGFLYLVYSFACGDWLLRGPFDFGGHWPIWLTVVRDVAVLTFTGFGVLAFARAVWAEVSFRRARHH